MAPTSTWGATSMWHGTWWPKEQWYTAQNSASRPSEGVRPEIESIDDRADELAAVYEASRSAHQGPGWCARQSATPRSVRATPVDASFVEDRRCCAPGLRYAIDLHL